MILSGIEAILGVVDRFARWGAGIALLVMTAVLFGNSLARFLFNVSFVGGEELARILVIWLTYLAAYLVVRANSHVAIDIVLRFVGEGAYRAIMIFVSVVGSFTAAYITWFAIDLCVRIGSGGQMSSVLPLPKVIFYLPLPIGFGLMAIGFLLNAVYAVRGTLERPEDLTITSASSKG